MQKDYGKWHPIKSTLNGAQGSALFHEREIWWCSLGVNVGYEQDGRGDLFARPVVILTKFNLDTCLVVPLTAKPKSGKYYFKIGTLEGRDAVANLSQIRHIDRKRLHSKMSTVDQKLFEELRAAVVGVCFPTLK